MLDVDHTGRLRILEGEIPEVPRILDNEIDDAAAEITSSLRNKCSLEEKRILCARKSQKLNVIIK